MRECWLVQDSGSIGQQRLTLGLSRVVGLREGF